jgi:hypothetical protein
MQYKATFSNGKTIKRNSKRSYTHAWFHKVGASVDYGFSATAELAKKASDSSKYGLPVSASEVVEIETL